MGMSSSILGNGTPLACSKLGGVPRYLYLLSFIFRRRFDRSNSLR